VGEQKLILVTGATGYIGGRLIPRLLESGWQVRCLARVPERLRGRAWSDRVDVVAGDLVSGENLNVALEGVSTAYYLVHNMSSGSHYPQLDLIAARNFARVAEETGVGHIIYLGGLADPEADPSPHMRSRIQTGEALREGAVPVTEFRASVIIGPGSISFEMIRFLTEHFPLLVGPRWLRHLSQPIAARDVLAYLQAALDYPACYGNIYEIGGTDVMTYAETMMEYAHLRGLRRWLIEIPYLPVWLMALVVDRLTPVPASIAQPLIEGLYSDSRVLDLSARNDFPQIEPIGYRAALQEALSQLQPAQVEPVWRDKEHPRQTFKHEGFFVDHRQMRVMAPPERVFAVVRGLGGGRGWLAANGLWQLRGWFDRLIGGPGLRGRHHPDELHVGEVLDFYRVELLEPNHVLRLYSELKAPGDGWMEWRVEPAKSGSWLSQTAYFAPFGLWGCLYWYALAALHKLVFHGLIVKIARQAEEPQHT
jgi:uncharacterized protein YbjT (DUF2867 family)